MGSEGPEALAGGGHTGGCFSPGRRPRRADSESQGREAGVGPGRCSACSLQGCWAITGFVKMALAAPLLLLGFLWVREPRYGDFRSRETSSLP